MANAARLKKHKQRLAAAGVEAEQRRLGEQWEAVGKRRATSAWRSTMSSAAQLNLYRARYGTGGVPADNSSGECPNCGWKWGSPETYIIGMPLRQWAD
jgi:hypothetical protein